MPDNGAADERTRALELVLRHGSSATASQTLHSGLQRFWDGTDAFVAYADTGRAWVAAGAPVTTAARRSEVVSAFLSAARAAGKRACFFAVDEPLFDSSGEALVSLSIGEQPVWDPRTWTASLARHRSLREQLRRARVKGVRARELDSSQLGASSVREQIESLCERWLSSRRLAPMAFLVKLEPFASTATRRTFVAEQNGRIIGLASLIPVPARGGWFLEHLIRAPDAPNGTSELLVHSVMAWAERQRCAWLTLGLAPLSGRLPTLLRLIRDASRPLYDFPGLRAYKAKFRPRFWQPAYLCYPRSAHALHAVLDTLSAFAQGGFWRFGLRTLRRGRALEPLRAWAVLLTPWSLLGPIWTAIAAAGYACRASLAAATSSVSSSVTSRSKVGPRAIGS